MYIVLLCFVLLWLYHISCWFMKKKYYLELRHRHWASHMINPVPVKCMMTSSNGNIFRVTGPLCGEFTGPGEFPAQRPVTRSFDVFFDLRPNKRLSKQPRGWWFDTSSWSLWRQCNGPWKTWEKLVGIKAQKHRRKYERCSQF